MKYAKANTLRTQQAIARFGKSAQHPVCLAALGLWQARAELTERMKDEVSFEKVLNSAKEQKKQARELLDTFYREGKQTETIQVATLVREACKHLPEVQKRYEAIVGLRSFSQESHQWAAVRYNRAYDAVVRAKDTKALRALLRVRKQWSANAGANGARLKTGALRTLGILQLLRDKVIKAAWAKGGASAGYVEALRGGNRLLSDEVWQGRCTVREIHSHLLATYSPRVAGDNDGKGIRRTLRSLGIRWAEDQRGRKWKPPAVRSPRPAHPSSAVEIMGTDKLEAVEAEVEKEKRGQTVEHEESLSWKMRNRQELAWARRVIKAMEREIAKLQLLRGGNRGKFVY